MNHDNLAQKETVDETIQALSKNNFSAISVDKKEQALEKIRELIPEGSSVMNGASMTLEQIGYINYVKENPDYWNNLHAPIVSETDPKKKFEFRMKAIGSDYYLGSAHAITESGEILVASNTGSQMPHLAFSSKNIILVVSTKKIVNNLQEALERIENHVVPLEDERMKSLGLQGTLHAKTLIMYKENPLMGRKILIIFVNEDLGF